MGLENGGEGDMGMASPSISGHPQDGESEDECAGCGTRIIAIIPPVSTLSSLCNQHGQYMAEELDDFLTQYGNNPGKTILVSKGWHTETLRTLTALGADAFKSKDDAEAVKILSSVVARSGRLRVDTDHTREQSVRGRHNEDAEGYKKKLRQHCLPQIIEGLEISVSELFSYVRSNARTAVVAMSLFGLLVSNVFLWVWK